MKTLIQTFSEIESQFKTCRIPLLTPDLDNHLKLWEKFLFKYQKLPGWSERLKHSSGRKDGFAAPGGHFTKALYQLSQVKNTPISKSLLSGQVLVELGAGTSPYGYLLASALGAKSYIGIEPFYPDYLLNSISLLVDGDSRMDATAPFAVVPQDMLSFLLTLRDRSVSILACGIEKCILAGERYQKSVEREIERVIHTQGFFISSQSDLRPKLNTIFHLDYRRAGSRTHARDRLVLYTFGKYSRFFNREYFPKVPPEGK